MGVQGAFSFFSEPVVAASGAQAPVAAPSGALPGRGPVRCYQCNVERVPHGRLLVRGRAVDLCVRCTVERVQELVACGAYVPPGYEWVAAWGAS